MKKYEQEVNNFIVVNSPNFYYKKKVPEADISLFNLYKNESIYDWEDEKDCFIDLNGQKFFCKLLLTEYRLLLIPSLPNKMLSLFQEDHFMLPIFSIIKVNKIDSPNYTKIELESDDWKHITLILQSNYIQFYSSLIQLTQPNNSQIFVSLAKKYNELFGVENDDISNINGWNIYSPQMEYYRQGINVCQMIKESQINLNFEVCDSYPEVVYIIKNFNIINQDIIDGAKFRAKGRFPTLSFYNKNSMGTIWRSGQVKRGIINNRCSRDEKILNSIAEISPLKQLKIFDARPKIAAMANKIKGAGSENIEFYKNTEIIFCNIGNIHEVRASYIKFKTLLTKNTQGNKNFFSQYEESAWPKFIHLIITSAIQIAYFNKKGYSILVHCSDGWDRSTQLISFAQLLLDPFYRTIEGFITLIEKEFVSFGHKFQHRNGFFCKGEVDESEKSPIFLQWLDCVHQLVKLYPFAFEFNIDLLIFIASNLTTCKYGTFLSNSNKERRENKVYQLTMSIWTDVLKEKKKYVNGSYNEKKSEEFELYDFPIYKIRIWEEFYLRYSQRNYYCESKYISSFQMLNEEKKKDLERIKELEEIIANFPKNNHSEQKVILDINSSEGY